MFKEKRFGCQASKENGPGQESMAEVCKDKCMALTLEDETLALPRCHNEGLP